VGASASLLLLEMHKSDLLRGASILLIDREKKNNRDKTFFFWSHEDESIVKSLADSISHSWNSVILPNKQEALLSPMQVSRFCDL